jgi:hypothetical protein
MSLTEHARKEIEALCIAGTAGLLAFLMRAFRKGRRVRWPEALIKTAASAFVGYLALHACIALKIDDAWVGVVVGCLGWIGAESSIAVIERLVFRRLGVPEDVAAARTDADRDSGK